MELPDCPPGAEGYQDSVVEMAKKKPSSEETDTKAEQEFNEHLSSLKIKLEDGTAQPMVERRGRDISGKWIYLCYPCAAMCSGESILQTHISGKKHKTKLAMRNVWPNSIFEEHPYILSEKGSGGIKGGGGATVKVLKKMAEEVDLHNKNPSELDHKYSKHRGVRCHIQDSFDVVKAPLLGLEYLIEHPPEEAHYEPSYICTLCTKHGHPRTIVNHITCFWHRYNYLVRHFTKACTVLTPYRNQPKYREGVSVIMNRLAQRIEDKFGRLKPINIEKEEYERDKERIHKWIFNGYHFTEASGTTFEEVVDVDLITSLHKSNVDSLAMSKRDPSPPKVVAPSKPHFNNFTRPSGRQERRAGSEDSLSDISDDQTAARHPGRDDFVHRHRYDAHRRPPRYDPYQDRRHQEVPFYSRYAFDKGKVNDKEIKRAPNYDYKIKLAEEKRAAAEESARKTLAYHEKNPEKHPLYPEEWKKFWNRRYKEIQGEGKDPSKHDFKPEWIVFWTKRMKELHDEEMRVNILEIYRKLTLSPPDMTRRSEDKHLDVSRRSPEPKRRLPEPRRRSPEPRRRSPPERRRSPELRLRRSPEPRRRSPDYRRDRRSPELRRSPVRRSPARRSPARRSPARRSPARRAPDKRQPSPRSLRSRSPASRTRSPARTHIVLESVRRSRSPLSRRGEASRNRSPQLVLPAELQTVMISDDELKPDDGLSPWNSDNDIESLGSLPDARSPVRARSHTGSMVSSRASYSHRDYPSRAAEPQDYGPAENVIATLRMLVALEDYLGSLGPKIVDLLTDALKMEKEKGNSSEELLVRESAVVLIETAKEKLKGAVQAGLVPHAAAGAVRAAVVRAAATLHEADTRSRRQQQQAQSSKVVSASSAAGAAAVPVAVAGVGAVDRAQIAQQMAAALIAQGKTDVSSEELAQLVDAVVGMAEAKKREAEVKKKVEARATADKASRPPPPPATAPASSGTASALQMLQSAYDENDKKPLRNVDTDQILRDSVSKGMALSSTIQHDSVPVDKALSDMTSMVKDKDVVDDDNSTVLKQRKCDDATFSVPSVQEECILSTPCQNYSGPGLGDDAIASSTVGPPMPGNDPQIKPKRKRIGKRRTGKKRLGGSKIRGTDKRMPSYKKRSIDKEDAPDAMDGLSDSDLETLLKNFNELSAEEQHSLIAYLKKLEAKEPERVERLRQYVSAAAATAPPPAEEAAVEELASVMPVMIESDDDDYTVEDVVKSATQKVKEDQIRQEMEIVKKSLSETKAPPAVASPPPKANPTIDLTKNMSSATDLLALVQASLQSTSSTNTAPGNRTAEVVSSNTQPRSFGDRPEAPIPNIEPIQPLLSQQEGPIQNDFQEEEQTHQQNNDYPPQRQQINDFQPQRGQMHLQNDFQPHGGPMHQQNDFQPQGGSMHQHNDFPPQGGQTHQQTQGGQTHQQKNDFQQQGGQIPQQKNEFQQQGEQMHQQKNDFLHQGGQMPQQKNDFQQQGGQIHQQKNDFQHQGGQMPQQKNDFQQHGGQIHQQNDFPPQGGFRPQNQMNFGDNRNFQNEPYISPVWDHRPINNLPDNRSLLGGPPVRGPGPQFDNFGQNQYNQGPGPRGGNFMNGRMQDNYEKRPPDMHQQFGNFDKGNNFRGRGGGRGNFGGHRGRGRGGYY